MKVQLAAMLLLLSAGAAESQTAMESKYEACLAAAVPNEVLMRSGGNVDQAFHDQVCRKTDNASGNSSSQGGGVGYQGANANYSSSGSSSSRNIEDFCQSTQSSVNATTQMMYWSRYLSTADRQKLSECLNGPEGMEGASLESDDGDNVAIRIFYNANLWPSGVPAPKYEGGTSGGLHCRSPLSLGQDLPKHPGLVVTCTWDSGIRVGHFRFRDSENKEFSTELVRNLQPYGLLTLRRIRNFSVPVGTSQICSSTVTSPNLNNVWCHPGCDACTEGGHPACQATLSFDLPNGTTDVHAECVHDNDGSCKWNGLSDSTRITQDVDGLYTRDVGGPGIGVRLCGTQQNYQTRATAENVASWRLYPGDVISMAVPDGGEGELQLNLNGNVLTAPTGTNVGRLIYTGMVNGPLAAYYHYEVR